MKVNWYKMNWNQQMDVHYVNGSFPYNSAGSYANFFEGLAYEHANFIFADAVHSQESMYPPPMQTNFYKFGLSDQGNVSYYDYNNGHILNGHASQVHEYTRHFENSQAIHLENSQAIHLENSPAIHLENSQAIHLENSQAIHLENSQAIHLENSQAIHLENSQAIHLENSQEIHLENSQAIACEQTATVTTQWDENAVGNTNPDHAECPLDQPNDNDSQVIWQDNVDLDNMTYEELLELGEAVGTENRGLAPELISLLPVRKFKTGFFSRKKSKIERCVICQMEYKRGERQMTLPCKHVYHVDCGSKWLSVNKACPICYTEVFGVDESKH
ncbi:E3 ubiquitin-protein ligase BIG BROTHER-like [Impatiens glandulifera]|uniref:E3 ubiquitin-protein ligase BIG BROTHER-like n=1 Tax=Impatiens glandulifera TaxID=253017 RepID=UPI001FB1522F|nr:E3 ubiquitin-protein ligase BIG BROTHER-like [Impatiens glandulifera]XP_047324916.1 E3 ubiquitin-protein ligase BIG BROTHER-like [Impatiens glandulifera]